MTTRQQIAAMALQGILANPNRPAAVGAKPLAAEAAAYADRLLTELDKLEAPTEDLREAIYQELIETAKQSNEDAHYGSFAVIHMLRKKGIVL